MATTICSSVKSSLPAWKCSQFSDLLHCSHPGFSLSRQGLQSRASTARSLAIHWPQGKGKGALLQELRFLGITRVLHGAPRRHSGSSGTGFAGCELSDGFASLQDAPQGCLLCCKPDTSPEGQQTLPAPGTLSLSVRG